MAYISLHCTRNPAPLLLLLSSCSASLQRVSMSLLQCHKLLSHIKHFKLGCALYGEVSLLKLVSHKCLPAPRLLPQLCFSWLILDAERCTPQCRRCGWLYLDLQGQVGADGVQQQFGGFLSTHQHKFQVHVPFDQQAFGHQADTGHAAQHRRPVRPEGRRMTASVSRLKQEVIHKQALGY